jgi:hypothetical protein
VVGGIPREVIRRLESINGLALDDNPPETLNFDPEAMKQVSDELLQAANVKLFYHLFAVEAICDQDRVESVIAAGKEGLWEIRAKVVIDTTGDGDISYFAGAEYEKDGQMQTMSQHFRIGGLTGNSSWETLEQKCRAGDGFRLPRRTRAKIWRSVVHSHPGRGDHRELYALVRRWYQDRKI